MSQYLLRRKSSVVLHKDRKSSVHHIGAQTKKNQSRESIRKKMGILERIKEIGNNSPSLRQFPQLSLELELSRTQNNKATNTHIGLLKSQLSKLRTQVCLLTCSHDLTFFVS
jgi:hypothetical protein